MYGRGVNKNYLKKRNRGLVLQLIATGECSSRIELSKKAGLTKTAISAIVNELMEQGYLHEAAPEYGKEASREQGRSPVKLEIGEESPRYAGVLIGRGYAEAVLCDMRLEMYKYERIDREWENGEMLIEAVCGLLDRILEGETQVIAIGVSTPGPVDVKQGKIINPGYFHGLKNISVSKPLEEKYGLPVFLDHDVQSVALVEQLFGNGQGYQDMLLLGIEDGVGCGIITGGRRYQSNSGYPPEIGHVSIDSQGNKCEVCGGIGCLETYISSKVIEKKAERILGEKKDIQTIFGMDDDPRIQSIMTGMVQDLSCAVVSLENILNFEIILLGMDSVYWPERCVQLLEDIINQRKYANKKVRTLVRKVRFLDKAMVLGAVCNAVNKTFEGDLID